MSSETFVVTENVVEVVEVLTEPTETVVLEEVVSVVEVDVGRTGPQGPASAFYEHVQSAASAAWTINHNLGFRPTVSAIDEGSQQIEGSVVHTSVNQLVMSFATPIAGRARCT
jgi:hypothetical protein